MMPFCGEREEEGVRKRPKIATIQLWKCVYHFRVAVCHGVGSKHTFYNRIEVGKGHTIISAL